MATGEACLLFLPTLCNTACFVEVTLFGTVAISFSAM